MTSPPSRRSRHSQANRGTHRELPWPMPVGSRYGTIKQGFQDPASDWMYSIIDLHDRIIFYLLIILSAMVDHDMRGAKRVKC